MIADCVWFRRAALAFALIAVSLTTAVHAASSYSRIKLFDGGTGGYHSYRIPSIVRTKNGHLLAFSEGRKTSSADMGQDIDIVMKRSVYTSGTGYGSWTTTPVVVLGNDSPDQWTWGNPTAVVDVNFGTNGRVWLFANRQLQTYTSQGAIPVGQRYTFTIYSDDEGLTWQGLTNRTTALGGGSIQFDFVGPGVGIQKTQTEVGQLVVPAKGRNFYRNPTTPGTDWLVRSVPSSPITPTETAIVECLDGSLMRSDRILSTEFDAVVVPTNKRRFQTWGKNETGFANYTRMEALLDPNCEGSLLRYNMGSPDRLLFMGSYSTEWRTKTAVHISYDDGVSYPHKRFLYIGTPPDNYLDQLAVHTAGKGGYSSMAKTADFHIGALVETNETSGNRSIDYHKFNLEWILESEIDNP